MSAGWPVLLFVMDALVVGWTAWMGACVAGLPRRSLVEGLLGWLLLVLIWVAASGVLLGLTGGFGRMGFLGLHGVVLVAMLAWRRGQRREDWHQARDWLVGWWRLWTSATPEAWGALGLALVAALLAVLGTMAEPIVFDALTYRLPRIGGWLQDGRIQHYLTDDPRLNYMPVAPDVVIAWLLGASNHGYRLAALAQLAGGILLLGATFGLARTIGLTRLAALGAVVIVLGMGNVAAQFTSLHSDLFTAGVFAASYLLWHRAWQRGSGSWVGGLGVAMAFGAKGTLFYLAPGALVWVGWLVWRHRVRWRALGPTAAGFLVGALVLMAPGYWQNQKAYGSPFGPRDAVVLHHGSFDSVGQHAAKLIRNLGTSGVQLFEPTSQPFWLQDWSQSAGFRLAARLPEEADPYVFLGRPRREQVEQVLRLTRPDADVITCGLLAAALFIGGMMLAAVRSHRAGAAQIAVWGAGVAAYLLTQHALVQWHHWAFRFMVLAAPWVGVMGAWTLAALPRKLQVAAWAVVLVSALQVFAMVQWQTGQSGWMAAMQPGRSASYFFFTHWRTWASRLDDAREPLRLAFPINRAVAAFYRLEPVRHVTMERLSALQGDTAEEATAMAPGWLLVPLDHFLGREGRVMARVGPVDVIAFRQLRAGEQPRPLLYTNKLLEHGGGWRRELMIRTWPAVPVRLELFNPAPGEIRFTVRTPTGQLTDMLPAGARRTWEIPVPADVLSIVTVDFPKGGEQGQAGNFVMVQLMP